MSYVEDIRGALAYTSGVSRRVQALKELKLPADVELAILDKLDQATDSLLSVTQMLKAHGIEARGSNLIAASAGSDKTWRERVYGGKKDEGTVVKPIPGKRTPRTYEQAFGEPTPKKDVDIAHPWRTE